MSIAQPTPNETSSTPSATPTAPSAIPSAPSARISRYWVERPRLLDHVVGLLDHQLVILRAAAGAGKSVLLHQLRAHCAAAAIPFTLIDRRDRSVRAALAESETHDTGHRLIAVDAVSLDADDCAVLLAALDARPDLTVVVSTRVRSALESGGVGISHDVALVDPALLAMTEDEVAAVLALNGMRPTQRAVERVHSVLGGWPACVQLAATSLRFAAVDGQLDDPAATLPECLADYAALFTAVFPADPEATSAIAALPYLDRSLLELAAPDVDAEPFLNALEAAGAGRWYASVSGRRFEIAPPLRRALGARADVSHLDAAVYDLLSDRGDTMTAIELASAHGDDARATTLLADHFDALRVRHRRRWQRATALLSTDAMSARPDLAVRIASLALVEHRTPAAAARLSRGLGALRPPGGQADPSAAVVDATLRADGHRLLGEYGKALEAAERIDDVLGAAPEGALNDAVRSAAHRAAGLAAWHARRGDDARRHLRSAAGGDPVDPHTAESFGALVLLDVVDGRVRSARSALEAAGPETATRSDVGALAIARAAIAAEDGEAATARGLLGRGEAVPGLVDAEGGFDEFWPLRIALRATLSLLEGDAPGAMSAVREGDALAHTLPASHRLRAILQSVRSDVMVALRSARTALEGSRGPLSLSDATAASTGRALALVGQHGQAFAFLSQRLARETFSERALVDTLLVQAAAGVQLGHRGAALDALVRAVEISRVHDLRMPWRYVPVPDRAALADLLPEVGEFLDDDAPAVFAAGLSVPTLSRREQIVLSHARIHDSVAQIAAALVVSPNTVKTQLRSIYRKLGVSSREEAITAAHEWRLLAPLAPSPARDSSTGQSPR